MARLAVLLCACMSLVLFASAATDKTPCDDPTVTSPADIKPLLSCEYIYGQFVIANNFTGAIDLTGVKYIRGNLTNEACTGSSCNTGLTSVTSSTMIQITDSVRLTGLTGLTNISFPALKWIDDTLDLEGLTALQEINLPLMQSVYQMRIHDAPKLAALNANLTTFDAGIMVYLDDGDSSRPEVLDLRNVGLSSLQDLVVGDKDADIVSLVGLPNLDFVQIAMNTSSLTVAGNGNLSVLFRLSEEQWFSPYGSLSVNLTNATLSGVSNISYEYIESIFADALTVENSTLPNLELWFDDIKTLTIANNTNLASIDVGGWPWARNWTLRNLIVRGNPALQLNTTVVTGYNVTPADWLWTRDGNLSTVILDGAVSNSFFQPLVDLYNTTNINDASKKHVKVLDTFEVTSSISGFDCGPLSDLKSKGVILGSFSCQGQGQRGQGGGSQGGGSQDGGGSQGGGGKNAAGRPAARDLAMGAMMLSAAWGAVYLIVI